MKTERKRTLRMINRRYEKLKNVTEDDQEEEEKLKKTKNIKQQQKIIYGKVDRRKDYSLWIWIYKMRETQNISSPKKRKGRRDF